jgi:hypothetical protein
VKKYRDELNMTGHSISIEFSGYWNEYNKGTMPGKSGIYCVYAGVEDPKKKTVNIQRLIYIGESADVHARLAHHDGIPLWRSCLKPGQALCFSFGAVADADRERSEAALIFHHKPPANIVYTDTFPFETTSVRVSRKAPLLESRFSVHPVMVSGAWHPPPAGLLRRGLQLVRAF